MADSTSRYITIYDTAVAPARVHHRPKAQLTAEDFRSLYNTVKGAAATANHIADDADAQGRRLYLMDMAFKTGAVAFVWTLADPRQAEQMYMHRRGAKLRAAAKGDDEDVAVSAHLVIDLSSPEKLRYPTALEDHEGIPRSRIHALLQKLLLSHIPNVTAVLEEGVEKTAPPKLLLDAHPGRRIAGTGLQPVEIEVVRQVPRRTLSASHADPFYESSERRLFRITREGLAAQMQAEAVSFVTQLRNRFPEHRIRIRWRDTEDDTAPGAITKVDPVDRPERLLERALTRTELLSGFRQLPDATETVIDRLFDAMLQRLRDIVVEDRGPR